MMVCLREESGRSALLPRAAERNAVACFGLGVRGRVTEDRRESNLRGRCGRYSRSHQSDAARRKVRTSFLDDAGPLGGRQCAMMFPEPPAAGWKIGIFIRKKCGRDQPKAE